MASSTERRANGSASSRDEPIATKNPRRARARRRSRYPRGAERDGPDACARRWRRGTSSSRRAPLESSGASSANPRSSSHVIINRLRHVQTEISRVSSDERREAPRRGNVPPSSWKLIARAFTNQIPQSRVCFSLVIRRLYYQGGRAAFAARPRIFSPSSVSLRPPRPPRLHPPRHTGAAHRDRFDSIHAPLLTRRTRTPA